MANIREFLYDNQNNLTDITSLLHLLTHQHELVFDSGKGCKSTTGEIALLETIINKLDDMHGSIEILLKSTKEV